MKKFLFSFSLLFLGICFSQAQMIKFTAQSGISKGPFMELKEDGYNLYSWYKKKGFMAKKLGALSHGNSEVYVTMLEIQRFDANGKFLESESHAVKLEDDGNGLGKYQISDKSVVKSGANVFATADDPTFRELVRKFPNSLDHSGGGVKAAEEESYTIIELFGKGLLGGKKPYSLTIEKSGEKESNKIQLADIPTKDPKAEWKTTPNTYAFVNDEKVIFPTWYQKADKKDKFGYLKNYKMVAYDEQGKIAIENDVTFDVPNELFKTMYVYDKDGNADGLLYVYCERFGLGWKKANPEPQKDLNTLYWFDNEKLNGGIELRSRSKSAFPSSPHIVKAISSEDGLRLFINKSKNKKQGVNEDFLDEYLCKDGKSELVKSYSLNKLNKSTSGEVSSRFLGSIQNMDKMVKLNNGGALYMGYSKGKSETGVTYGDCFYLTTNADGSIKNIGRVESGATAATKSPNISLEKLEGDNVFIKINNRTNGTNLWILDTATGGFTSVKPKTDINVSEVMRKDNTIFFIGSLKEGKQDWIVEKFDL